MSTSELETMSHGHCKHWSCQHNSYLVTQPSGDCGQIGDNPQIQLSGVKWPSAGVTECTHFPGLQGVTLVKGEMCDTG